MEHRLSATELARNVGTLREALDAWSSAAEPDPAFADDLERVSDASRPPDRA